MEQSKIDRINEFTRRVRAGEQLNPQELEERQALRQEYINSYKRSLVNELEHTYIVDEKGNKTKLHKKSDIIKS